jgi:putative endonuclease
MKNNSKIIGNYYENLAKIYLEKNQYKIITQNYRFKTIDIYKPLELDIIAIKEDVIYFFEVKYRRNSQHLNNFFPSSYKKIQNIIQCGENFLYHNPHFNNYFMNISWIIINNNEISILNLY